MTIIRRSPLIVAIYTVLGAACAASEPPAGDIAATQSTRIQFEDFRQGGEGVGYHDEDGNNAGGAYRLSDGVDIERRGEPDGFNVGWLKLGEWLEYEVTVPTDTTYQWDLRLAADANPAMSISIDVDGGAHRLQYDLSPGLGLDTYQSATAGFVDLAAGNHKVRVTMSRGSYGANLDYFELVPRPRAQQRVQFENFASGGEGVGYHDLDATNRGGLLRPAEGVDIEQRGGVDGYNIGWVQQGEWLRYNVDVPTTAPYEIRVQLAAHSVGMELEFDIDNGAQRRTVAITNGQSLDGYERVVAGELILDAGSHDIKVTVTKGDYAANLDYFELVEQLQASPQTLFYVATNGDDKSPGTKAQPWRSLQHAAQTLTAGQTVLVADGDYVGVDITGIRGQAGKPIVFRAQNLGKARVVVEVGLNGFIIKDAAHFHIIGFDILYQAQNLTEEQKTGGKLYGAGMDFSTSHHILLKHNSVRDFPGSGIAGKWSDYMTVESNEVSGNSLWSPYATSGISFYESIDHDTHPAEHFVVRGNRVFNNENRVPFTAGGMNVITDGNCIIIDDGRRTQNFFGGPEAPPYQALTLIENNICAGNGGRGIHVFESDNVIARNNTLYQNNKTPSISGELSAYHASNVTFANNIVVSRRQGTITGNASNVVFVNNLYAGTDVPDRSASDIVGSNPALIAPGFDAGTANFRVQSGSPVINIGKADQSSPRDVSGARRDAMPDVGAWEYR